MLLDCLKSPGNSNHISCQKTLLFILFIHYTIVIWQVYIFLIIYILTSENFSSYRMQHILRRFNPRTDINNTYVASWDRITAAVDMHRRAIEWVYYNIFITVFTNNVYCTECLYCNSLQFEDYFAHELIYFYPLKHWRIYWTNIFETLSPGAFWSLITNLKSDFQSSK